MWQYWLRATKTCSANRSKQRGLPRTVTQKSRLKSRILQRAHSKIKHPYLAKNGILLKRQTEETRQSTRKGPKQQIISPRPIRASLQQNQFRLKKSFLPRKILFSIASSTGPCSLESMKNLLRNTVSLCPQILVY